MPSGHVRWLLEQFEFDFEVVYPATLDAGNLKAKYDVILFPDGGIPESGSQRRRLWRRPARAPRRFPAEYPRRGSAASHISTTMPQLKSSPKTAA